MSKYIPDIKNHRWVILAPNRFGKPHAKTKDYHVFVKDGMHYSKDCPFCFSNESQTPVEIDSIKKGDQWQVRVFSNQYPITDIHEVIVHHPDHRKEIQDMSHDEVLAVFTMYKRRLTSLSKQGVPILFRNRGDDAGTSIPHPHSQIILLPSQINLEALSLEPIKNVVYEKGSFIAYCPDFSQYPYEVWIAHSSCVTLELSPEKINELQLMNFDDDELGEIGSVLQKSVRALQKILGDFSYNFYISPKPPFYLRLIPRLVTRGGFELGTGLSTNIIDPAVASAEIKKNM